MPGVPREMLEEGRVGGIKDHFSPTDGVKCGVEMAELPHIITYILTNILLVQVITSAISVCRISLYLP